MSESKKTVALVILGVVGVVVLASIALVRVSNHDRALSPGVMMAIERIGALPDSAMAPFPVEDFRAARERFTGNLNSGNISTDSVRVFYQSYALWARDGVWDSTDVRQLGAYLGLSSP